MSDQRQPEAPVAPGDVLVGKYRVERVLGIGGMGVVVAAHHLHLDERVAIKFLLPEVARQGGEPVARFMREGRAAAKIRSEHVARVTDVGALEDGTPFLVMEYLEGSDLAKTLEDSGTLAVDDALDYVLQACEALAEAHAIGIVHRDLKPANLFLARRADGSPCIKVLDFGISKMTNAGGLRGDMTRTRATLGSPLYMSPEQLVSTGDVDARADLWSLGVILFELLTGRLPYEAETMPQLVAQVLQNPPARLRALRPDISVELDGAVMRCLQPAPMRFQTIGELARALEPFAPPRAHISIQRVTRLFGAPTGQTEPESASAPERASRPGSIPDASPHARTLFAAEPHGAGATPAKVLAQSGSLSVSMHRAVGSRPRPRALGLAVIGGAALLAIVGGALLVASRYPPPVPASAAPATPPAMPPSSPAVGAPPAASTVPAAEPTATTAPQPTAPPKAGSSAARPRTTPSHVTSPAPSALPIPNDRQ